MRACHPERSEGPPAYGRWSFLCRGSLAALGMTIVLLAMCANADTPLQKMIAGAKSQVGKTRSYDPSYRSIAYPGGDVPLETGVCSDVVIRAFRRAGLDLQVLVHEDMKDNFRAYPRNWGLRAPDRNIDHRRVPNLATFFRRKGRAVTGDYKPGDVVTWLLAPGVHHIGIVSDVRRGNRYLMVHNIGNGAQLEDMLYSYEITGHYRWF